MLFIARKIYRVSKAYSVVGVAVPRKEVIQGLIETGLDLIYDLICELEARAKSLTFLCDSFIIGA